MDPNVILEEIREAADSILLPAPSGERALPRIMRHADLMVERHQALDEWLTNGGALPDAAAPLIAAAERERTRRGIADAIALHKGVHQCVGGSWWNNGDESYHGDIASPGPCPTVRALARTPDPADSGEGKDR